MQAEVDPDEAAENRRVGLLGWVNELAMQWSHAD